MPLYDHKGREIGGNEEAVILNHEGMPVRSHRETPKHARGPIVVQMAQPAVTEMVRSFSYKLNLKNADGSPAYEDCQFFCSKKVYADPGEESEASRDTFEFCVEEVLEDIKYFQARRAKRIGAGSASRSNAA